MLSQLAAGLLLLMLIVGAATIIGTLVSYGSTKPISYPKRKKLTRHGWW